MSRLSINFIAALLTLLCAASWTPAFAQERTYDVYVCKIGRCAGYQMPLAISEVRNLQSEQWWRDLEVEVKNISNRPIYYIRFMVGLPDTGSPRGDSLMSDRMWGVSLRYGRPELINISRRAESGDVPLNPGESYVFKIPEIIQGTFSKQPEALTKRVELRIDTINFGDGTGVVAGGEPETDSLP